MSDAKQTNPSNITHLNEDFGQESPWILRDMALFGQVNGKHGRKQILLPQEAETIRARRIPQPKLPYVQTLLKKAYELKDRLNSTPGKTQTSLAKELGVSRVRVTQILRLLDLSPEIQAHILSLPASSKRILITENSLRKLVKISNHQTQSNEFKRLVLDKQKNYSPAMQLAVC